MMKRRTFLASGAATLAAWRAFAQTQSHVVGTLFPMSGSNAEFGTLYTNAVQLALDHITADRMLMSPIELRSQDSQATPQGGAVGMTRLATVDKASYVLLGFTGVSKAAAPIGGRNKVVMINGGGVGPDLATLSPYFVNIIPLANKEVTVILPWLAKEGLKRVALIYVDDPLGQSINQEFAAGLPKQGGTLVGAFSVPPTQQQFGAIAARVRDVKPDAIYFATPIGTQLSQMAKQLRDNGITQQFVTYSVGNLPSIVAQPESEGMIFTGQAADWASNEPKIKRFVEGWRTKYKAEPVTYALNYYNGLMLFAMLAQGLERAGTPVTGETLLAELMRVRTFQLAGGEVTFDEHASASSAIQISRVHGGRSEKIG
ncbi:branched-chain amino acid ABC transporter substrate-binding protein [Methylobacterium platani JCM 14648]|uniref:Branched-chain amino acid ABC transporter substrate-binding protein n=3 Tax=Methylobacterium platani TaxID=427683 RepID=A0A179S244_9HYPH|nr:branched-chain amino acid ABC transporter substrate-binding protein [Methylobacterium platani JCM 14648]OAS16206.1 branched-chain amino acid ABC transporter substrate-binding protein [Methylobacterium platani]